MNPSPHTENFSKSARRKTQYNFVQIDKINTLRADA